MKNYFHFVAIVMLAIATTFSCSHDDDSSNNASSAQSYGVITASDGSMLWLTSVGSIDFIYDNAVLTGISYDDFEMSIDYNPLSFIVEWTDEEDADETTTVKSISTNSSGYITKMAISELYERTGVATITTEFSYNSSGRLETFKEVSNYTDSDGSGQDNVSAEYSWKQGGVLDCITLTFIASYSSGGQYSATHTYEFDYDYEYYPNVAGMWVPGNVDLISWCFWNSQLIDPLFYGGLLGKGAAYLPVRITEVGSYSDGEESYSESYSISNTLNSDGTLKYTRISDRYVSYFSGYLSYADYSNW